MNRFYTLVLILGLAVMTGTVRAESIGENLARSIAEGFMASQQMPATSLKLAQKRAALNTRSGEKAAYYVFNGASAQSGYVIVAGDDRAPAVLGYSDKGTFDTADIPEAMQELLDSYAEQIEALDNGAEAAPLMSTGPAIRPLLSCVWSQKSPFNRLMPFVNGNRSVAGCVASAAAQIMYYWRWPARPTATIPAYTTSTYGIYMPALEPVNFEWSLMQDSYLTSDTTSAESLAAATLMLYCAQSVEMDYKDITAGATTTYLPLALSSYFGYKASAHTLSRMNYTTEEWIEVIYNELAASRPLIYSGNKASGGHAFVCDGYDGNGMFHINWGWNSQSNGYFLLNVLNPDIQGTGSASGGYGYIYGQAAIIGIEPGEGNVEFALTSSHVDLNGGITTRSSISANFTATVSGRFYNFTSQTWAVDIGWGLYDGETMTSILYNAYNNGLRPGRYLNHENKDLTFGKNLISGTYRIVPIYSERNAGNWRPCIGAEKNYIEVTINGNRCTLKGYGSASTPDYQVNDVTFNGMMHHGRPVDINVSLTNKGERGFRFLYMFVNGEFSATGLVDIATGATDVIPFRYLPSTAGNYTLSFSFNEDGSNPIVQRTLTITQMPAATLTATVQVLNVTDAENKIITSDKFSAIFTITNSGTTTYDEDISVKLFKHTYGSTGTNIQAVNKRIYLLPGETTTLQFDMDNVVNGWRYFVTSYYYSAGSQVKLKGSSFHTIVFPNDAILLGDVNNDSEVNIADVNAVIDIILGGQVDQETLLRADVNKDKEVNIADLNEIIDILLGES